MNQCTIQLLTVNLLAMCWVMSTMNWLSSNDDPKDWKHERTPISGIFLSAKGKLHLYTLDLDGHLAKWEVPSFRLVKKRKLLEPEEGTAYGFMAGALTKEGDLGSVISVVSLTGADVTERLCLVDLEAEQPLIGYLERAAWFAILDNNTYLVCATRLPAEKVEFCLYQRRNNKLVLRHRWQYDHPIRWIQYCDISGHHLRILYEGVDMQELPILREVAEPFRRIERLGASAPLHVSIFDINSGKLLQSSALGIRVTAETRALADSSPTSVGLRRKQQEIVLASWKRNTIVLSLADFKLKQILDYTLALAKEKKESKENDRSSYDGVRCVFDREGRYFAYTTSTEVVVRNWATGEVLIYDFSHKALAEKLARRVKDPLGAVFYFAFISLKDMAFIDEHKLAVLAGSGHVYMYDLQQRKCLETILLAR